MSGVPQSLLEETAEDLFEDAPCGYLTSTPEGLIARVNRTFEAWTGYDRERLVGNVRFQELLSRGGQIYFETHYAPLLQMQGAVREIAVEIVRSDGSTLPALVNSVVHRTADGSTRAIRTTIFDATDRRRYEEELVAAREREREIAQRLQRSMLPSALPEVDAVGLGVAYRSGERALEVGGDWYDAFWLEEGSRMMVVVGDVVGRGLDAAADMGQIRSATRALAPSAGEPAVLLETLDELAGRHGFGRWSTVACATLDLEEVLITYSCAGHPPPIIARASSPPEIAWGGRSIPLDAHMGGAPRRESATVRLEPGARVVLYTDGLVERRGTAIDVGIERLAAAIARAQEADPQALADSLLDELLTERVADDVCLVAMHLR